MPSVAFITKSIAADNLSGNIIINGATLSNLTMNDMTLTASVDSKSQEKNFKLIIKDPCDDAVLQPATPSPLSDMSIIMYYQTTETMLKTVKILTNVENFYPSIVCPITAVLTPTLSYITLSADYA
jgi:hypothetical protein